MSEFRRTEGFFPHPLTSRNVNGTDFRLKSAIVRHDATSIMKTFWSNNWLKYHILTYWEHFKINLVKICHVDRKLLKF